MKDEKRNNRINPVLEAKLNEKWFVICQNSLALQNNPGTAAQKVQHKSHSTEIETSRKRTDKNKTKSCDSQRATSAMPANILGIQDCTIYQKQ